MLTIIKRAPKVEAQKITMDLDAIANRKPKRIGNPNLAKVKPIKKRQGLLATMRPLPQGFTVISLIPKEQAETMGLKRKAKKS